MIKINMANWPYFVKSLDGRVHEPLNSLDCIGIHLQLQAIKQMTKRFDSKIYLPTMDITLDLLNMTAYKVGQKDPPLQLIRSESSKRMRTCETCESKKGDGNQMQLLRPKLNPKKPTHRIGAFQLMYCKEVKGIDTDTYNWEN